jgi:hypothetical protein
MLAGLSLVALSVVASAATPAAADDAGGPRGSGGRYAGRTSQGEEISFRVARNHLNGVRLGINVVCPSRRVWKVTAVTSAPIKVVDGQFRQSFSSRRRGAAGTITIKGKLGHGRAAGTVRIKRFIAPEHHYCSGTTSFSLRRSAPRPDTGERFGWAMFAHSSRRYYDVLSERPASGPTENSSKFMTSWIPDEQR